MTLLHTYAALSYSCQCATKYISGSIKCSPLIVPFICKNSSAPCKKNKEQKHAHCNSPGLSPLPTLSAINFRQYTLSACHGRSVSILYIFKSHIYPPIIRNISQSHKRGTTNLECIILTNTNQQSTISTPCKPAVLFDAPQISAGMH